MSNQDTSIITPVPSAPSVAQVVAFPKISRRAIFAAVGFLGLLLTFIGYIKHYTAIDDCLAPGRLLLRVSLYMGVVHEEEDPRLEDPLSSVGMASALGMAPAALGLVIAGYVLFAIAGVALLCTYRGGQRKVWIGIFATVIVAQFFAFVPRIFFLARASEADRAYLASNAFANMPELGRFGKELAIMVNTDGVVDVLPKLYVSLMSLVTAAAVALAVLLRLPSGSPVWMDVMHKGVFLLGFLLTLWSLVGAGRMVHTELTARIGVHLLVSGAILCAASIVSFVGFRVYGKLNKLLLVAAPSASTPLV